MTVLNRFRFTKVQYPPFLPAKCTACFPKAILENIPALRRRNSNTELAFTFEVATVRSWCRLHNECPSDVATVRSWCRLHNERSLGYLINNERF